MVQRHDWCSQKLILVYAVSRPIDWPNQRVSVLLQRGKWNIEHVGTRKSQQEGLSAARAKSRRSPAGTLLNGRCIGPHLKWRGFELVNRQLERDAEPCCLRV